MKKNNLSYYLFCWLMFGMKKAVLMAALICLAISAVSCRSVNEVVKEVPVEVHDTAYIAKTIHDSTYIDRWHTVEVKGDTVFLTKNQITVKYRTVTDTAYKYIEKPVRVTVEQIKEVEKEQKWWQKMLMWFGAGFILVVMGSFVFIWLSLKNRI